ncbi:DUF6263 family protein [Corynebacterium sp. H128]|uniref:DUF6263 family protein n=1 Tax=Corynebacterium sp. H128 TaxID=3133427 RepID=UPI0030976AC7
MKKSLASCLAVTLSVFALTACGNDAPQQSEEKAVSLPVDAPKVALIDAGVGDAQVLAFHDSGATQQSAIEISDGFEQGTGTAADIAAEPATDANVDTLKATLDAAVSAQSPRDVTLKLLSPTHSKPEFASDTQSTEGFELAWTGQPTGRAETVRLSAPTAATDQGRAIAELYLMKLLAQPVIFPSEPIAPGAKWTVENRVTGDSTMLRSTTYTLNSREGDVADIAVEVSERPAVAALSLADQGLNSELKVVGTHSTGSGSLQVDLRKPLPVAGSVDLATRVLYGEDDKPARVFQDFISKIDYS